MVISCMELKFWRCLLLFGENHYVPVLKWKRGEQKALEFLDDPHKKELTPLIEIVPIPYDFVNDCPAKSINDHLVNTGDQIKRSWGEESPAFLDLNWLDDTEVMDNGIHPLTSILEDCRSKNVKIIPVTGSDRGTNYQAAVRLANQIDHLGICIRLEDDDFLDMETVLNGLLEELETEANTIDLIIDFKSILPGENKKNAISALSVIKSIPYVNDWRTLTLCSSSFPESLSSIRSENTGYIERSEWLVWKTLKINKSKLNRMPSFGDYAIANPSYSEIDPRFMQMTANIRYTGDNEYIIFKGRLIKRHGWEQIYELCKQAVNHPQYCGKDFSWGDKHIFECANLECTTGNSETWRRVGTNHHLMFVVEQLASFSGS